MLITIPDVLTAAEVTQARSALDPSELGRWQGDRRIPGAERERESAAARGPSGSRETRRDGSGCVWHVLRSSCRRRCLCRCFRRCSIATPAADTSARTWIPRFAPWLQPDSGFAPTFLRLFSSLLPESTTAGNCLWRIPTASTASSCRRTHGALSGDQPASRHSGNPGSARGFVFLDPEHDPQRRRPHSALRSGYRDSAACERSSGNAAGVQLTGVYHNLLRRWAEM